MTDNRMIIATVVGTGIAMTTVIVAFIGIIADGINDRRINDINANVNSRIDALNTSVNNRIDDLNTSVNSRFNDVNSRIDNVNSRIDDLQDQMRELRALVIDAIKGADPADNDE
ncbi:MAG: hypothetical protein OXG04_11760 [Acidobacteria bacterium]|nr:hypothetical protein [Acidobacteriota bacterium]